MHGSLHQMPKETSTAKLFVSTQTVWTRLYYNTQDCKGCQSKKALLYMLSACVGYLDSGLPIRLLYKIKKHLSLIPLHIISLSQNNTGPPARSAAAACAALWS